MFYRPTQRPLKAVNIRKQLKLPLLSFWKNLPAVVGTGVERPTSFAFEDFFLSQTERSSIYQKILSEGQRGVASFRRTGKERRYKCISEGQRIDDPSRITGRIINNIYEGKSSKDLFL